MFCPKNETAVILTKVKIFSSDAAVVAAGSGQLERRQGVPTAPSDLWRALNIPSWHHGQSPWPKRKKKNSFLLMLKQHRETKLLNHTSYNIVCTLLCIEHFLLPIKKQQPRVWKNDDIRRRFCLRQGELQLTILPEGPNTKSPWPDIERENQLTTTLQWSHLTTTTTQNHPQNILPMVQLTQRWKWRFFSQFLCVLSRCFLLLMIQKVSQSYPNARGVKKGLISTRGVSVEVIFDGKGGANE